MVRLQASQQSDSASAPPARRIIRRTKPEEPPPEPPPEPQSEPLLYDVAGACRMLGGISRGMLYRLINTKELRAVKIGGRTLVSADELKRYVDSL